MIISLPNLLEDYNSQNEAYSAMFIISLSNLLEDYNYVARRRSLD